MKSLSGFNSQEIRRLHPYLSALLRRIEALEEGTGIGGTKIIWAGGGDSGGGVRLRWGDDGDIRPTGDSNSAGSLGKVARADHQHLFKFPTTAPASTPDGSAYFDPSASAIRVFINNTPTTRVVAGGTTADVQPTGTAQTGTAPRYAFADHSHPTALLPQSNPQTPVPNEIRFNTDNKVVRWNGSAWVPLSVETFEVEWGTNSDVQPTRLRSAGSSTRFARADHSHPTAILPQSNAQTPVADEIRYNAENKLVRWNGSAWVPLSVETFTINWGTLADVQATGARSAGTVDRVARADHSHPTALLPQSNSQTPVDNEIRYNANNKLVRWNGSAWVELSVETVEAGTDADIQPTRLRNAGSSSRFARSDHSHPTALLPQSNSQPPVVDEIRYNADSKLVRWNGTEWVPLSVETFTIDWGTNSDVQATKLRSEGTSTRVARADHSHPTAILPQSNTQTPVEDEIRYNAENKVVRWDGSEWVPLSVETFTIDWGTDSDVQPTGIAGAGSVERVARADHSHPTALLPEDDTQLPVVGEIRYNADDKIVRWNGSEWVPLSVETFTIDWGTDSDVQATGARNAGTVDRVARADHSHPTALLPQGNSQTPVVNEIRFSTDNKVVRWDGSNWVPLSVETFIVDWATNSDVQPTKLRSTGTSARFARADHSHPTALLPQSDNQTPVVDEIRYTGSNQLVRWNGSAWVNLSGGLPVPANPLILPFTSNVSNPQNRQLLNHSNWDDIGNGTIFYYDDPTFSYRLVFARPLVCAITFNPTTKNIWSSKTNELILKYNSQNTSGSAGVLWSRGGNTTTWSPVLTQLIDSSTESLTSDVGVLARSALTGTSGSKRWFIRGAQEDGSFRAPFAGIATFTSSTVPSYSNLATNLSDGYGYFIHDLDRVDIVKPITDGNKYCTMLTHHIISPICRVFRTDADQSGHYVRDETWNAMWVVAFYTTTSATTNLFAIFPSIAVPIGIVGGRMLIYLHNPQSSAITTIFAGAVRVPTSTATTATIGSNITINIPANTTVVADLGYLEFPPSTTLSHHRSHLITVAIIRRRADETANANKVICLGVVIVPQRAS